MTEQNIIELGLILLGGLMTIIGYLLQLKDEKQQKDIDEMKRQHQNDVTALWTKHDLDVEQLRTLELHIASQHYNKLELDGKFDKMEASMREGFKVLATKFDDLNRVLIEQFKK